MRLALAIASFVVLIVHGVVFYDQFFHKLGAASDRVLRAGAVASQERAENARTGSPPPRIEQTIVTSFGDTRVDRCTTCHIASDDPRFAKSRAAAASRIPIRRRWAMSSATGAGSAATSSPTSAAPSATTGRAAASKPNSATARTSSGPSRSPGYVTQATWRKDFAPKLKGKEYMEANCAQCHTAENFAGTPNVNRGRKLFYAMNCYGCHKIDGMSEGTLGPDLTEAGKKFKVDYLWESIVEPRANLATSASCRSSTCRRPTCKSLVIFLKSRRGVNFAETSLDRYKAHVENVAVVIPPGTAGEKAGEQLITDRACTACHKLGDRDGGIAPDLSYEGLIRDNAWLMDHFTNPRSRVPDSIMPSLPLPGGGFPAHHGIPRQPEDAPAADVARRDLQGALRALPRREGRRRRQSRLVSRPLAARSSPRPAS